MYVFSICGMDVYKWMGLQYIMVIFQLCVCKSVSVNLELMWW